MKTQSKSPREREAVGHNCSTCRVAVAGEFCGSLAGGAECHKPLCKTCADIRDNIWLCWRHSSRAKQPKRQAKPKPVE